MGYKWKPNAAQRRAFALRMQDPAEREAYEQRKAEKRKYGNWSQKSFIPTREQHDFCFRNLELFDSPEEQNAANIVMSGYSCSEKVHHSFIHIVNEKRRQFSNL